MSDHIVDTEKHAQRRKRVDPKILDFAQDGISLLGGGMVLIVLIFGMFMMAAYAFNFCWTSGKVGIKMFEIKVAGNEGLIGALEFIDSLFVLTVMYLIIGGTLQIFVRMEQDDISLASALRGMTSGKLKEKLSSSLIMTSAIFLLRIMVQLPIVYSDKLGGIHVSWENVAIYCAFHALFIAGYFVIAHSNRHDPHNQPATEQHDKSESAHEHTTH